MVCRLDVSITEPATATGLAAGAAVRALAAARARENSKRSEWTKRAEGDGKVVTVVPCVMETTGAVGKDFLDFIRNPAGLLSQTLTAAQF